MPRLSRRSFAVLAGAALGTSLARPRLARGAQARVVVVGGGFGGATAARYLKRLDQQLDVTLIEAEARFVTCPFSNLVLAGLKTMDDITHGYDGLAKAGVRVVQAVASRVERDHKRLALSGGEPVPYDRLVLSPGIDLKFDALPGYDKSVAERLPHAWKAGPQTVLLQRQLEAMPDGGTFITVCPDNPYRCPPGPYERASMVAHYFKTRKPKSKILLLDAKESFSKQALFEEGWQALYGGMIEWMPGQAGGKVTSVDAKAMAVMTEFGDHKGDVISIIPPQSAGEIARSAGLADAAGWCAVDFDSFRSKVDPDIHVIGDAAVAAPMPKSATAANGQAKVAALAIVASLAGRKPEPPVLTSACYSMIAPKYAVSVANVYRATAQGLVTAEGGGVSPIGAGAELHNQEAKFAEAWYRSITQDMFA